MAIDDLRIAFGMETDEIQWNSGLARLCVDAARAVLEKISKKRTVLSRPCCRGTADFRVRKHLPHSSGSDDIEFVIFLGRSVEVRYIRLVPHFPHPQVHVSAIALMQMFHPRNDQSAPLCVILRRIRPSGPD